MVASRSPRRTQAQRRSESEEALLVAAAQLVAERGIDGATLSSIGERAGTSRGLPTHHFGTKDALIAALAQRAQDRISDALAAVPRPAEATALDGITRTFDTYLGLFEDPSPELRALLVLWGSTFPSESSIDGMREAEARSYRGWAETIEAGHRDGSIRTDVDPDAGAVLLLGMARGVAALLLVESGLTDMGGVRESARRWIEAALGT